MRHSATKLLKGSLMQAILPGLILGGLLLACNSAKNSENSFPLLGKWKITTLITSKSAALDEPGQKIYQQEVNKILNSSFMVFTTDSTYQLKLGPSGEKGRWKWDPVDSLLLLQADGGAKSYYTLVPNGKRAFKLKKALDIQGLVLVIENLPD